ncbi:Anosmin-1 [Triplophysa tibetana]|uniref:Anosmin-1 n=1 Tax=Triplophysa tibetana TaxID=1572043 RepID=A0A5A9PM65_9TELE|nr:Anosmin-1 [Triplophysa tibetana]
MRGAFTGLCVGITLLLNSGFVVLKRQDSSSALGSIFRTRCAARCLSLHSTRIALSTRHFQCLEPCKDSWELKDGPCQDLCEQAFPKRHGECVTSCEFLRSVMVVKQGDCPAPERASGFAAACVEGCEEDGECSSQKKCCPNGCGHTCQSPKNLYRGAPLKPRKELVFEELQSGGAMEVRWSSKFNVSAEPVLNVLQRRWNYGIHPSEDGASEWQVLARTSEQRVWLRDIRPGRWYQFRVAAVNVHGTRGYTIPSRHFRSSKDPAPPLVPSDLHVSDMTSGADRSVSVRLSWIMTADLDIPVNHFKLSWSNSDHTLLPKLKRRQSVNGDSTYAELDDLRENRSYVVELQAVSYWGQLPLKGSKAILQFTTNQRQSNLEPTVSPVFLKPQSDLLDVGTPFYQDGQLQVRVYWKKGGPLLIQLRLRCTPRLHPGRGPRREGPLLISNLPGSSPDETTPGKTTSGPTVTAPSLTGRYGTQPASFPKPGPYQGLAPTCSKRELFPPGVLSSRSHTPPDCARRTDLTPWRGVRPHTFDSCHHSRSDSVCHCPARQAKTWSQPSLRGSPGDIRLAPPADEPPSVGMKEFNKKLISDPTVNRYRVQWSPEFCSHNGSRTQEKLITQENFASLRGLHFSCKYKVIIQPVGSKARTQAESTTFYTPSCATIQSKSPRPIPCSTASVVPQKVLIKAENLTAAFSVYMGNVTGLFSWVVAIPKPPQQVTGYQVTWAELITESRRNNLPNSLISQSQILPPERNILVVSGLQLASLYRLEVQVITTGGQGPVTSRTFQTPAQGRPVLHYTGYAVPQGETFGYNYKPVVVVVVVISQDSSLTDPIRNWDMDK